MVNELNTFKEGKKMTAETMLKRINTKRKEIVRYEKEIARYKKVYLADGMADHMKAEGTRWINYYRECIARVETKIAEMSKEAARLANEDERKAMIKAMAEDMEKRGFKDSGYTTNGLQYSLLWNQGLTHRSKHCYTMYIEGKGTVFTSGTLETVAEYILNN